MPDHESSAVGGRLIVYSDYICPFSYLAEHALGRLREEGAQVEYRPFELYPAPAPLPAPDDEGDRKTWRELIRPLAARFGVEIERPTVRPRSAKAHEAARFAGDRGRFLEMHAALFRAYFVRGRDIGRIDVLTELGEELGLDRTELKVALDIDTYTDGRIEAEREAEDLGVTGVPTFRHGDELLVGLQPYGRLRAFARGE